MIKSYNILILILTFPLILLTPGCGSKNNTDPDAVEASKIVSLSSNSTLSLGQARILEIRLLQLVNAYRKSKGKRELIYDAKVSDIARVHSEKMARGSVLFGHEGMNRRFDEVEKYINLQEGGENVAMNGGISLPLEEALKQWRNSPGHNKNMLASWGEAGGGQGYSGMGIAKSAKGSYYFTQLFVGGFMSQ